MRHWTVPLSSVPTHNAGKRGEVCTAELNGKRRPVVIVSSDHVVAEFDHLIATVTSQQARNEFDVVIEYWKGAGLDKSMYSNVNAYDSIC